MGRNGRLEESLSQAMDWLRERNATNARAWALGEEQRYQADQELGRLVLIFRDGKRIVLPAQIIASFQPGNRTTCWAWANESVDASLSQAALLLRQFGEELGVAELLRPRPELEFDRLSSFAALAARRFGCEGLYRCIRGPFDRFRRLRRAVAGKQRWSPAGNGEALAEGAPARFV